jgi:murein DD-endopeptidase MepM/ murein hydrolase activator NlpD
MRLCILLAAAAACLVSACGSPPRRDLTAAPGDETPPPPGIGETAPPATETPNRIDPPEPMPEAETAFRWPVKGTVVERRGGAGIVIRAAGEVVAAKSGRVQLILSAWHGRRNLVILRHADGFLSEVSDVDEILVPAGKAVRQGEPIARLRATGTMRFRLYREKQALDPVLFLP